MNDNSHPLSVLVASAIFTINADKTLIPKTVITALEMADRRMRWPAKDDDGNHLPSVIDQEAVLLLTKSGQDRQFEVRVTAPPMPFGLLSVYAVHAKRLAQRILTFGVPGLKAITMRIEVVSSNTDVVSPDSNVESVTQLRLVPTGTDDDHR